MKQMIIDLYTFDHDCVPVKWILCSVTYLSIYSYSLFQTMKMFWSSRCSNSRLFHFLLYISYDCFSSLRQKQQKHGWLVKSLFCLKSLFVCWWGFSACVCLFVLAIWIYLAFPSYHLKATRPPQTFRGPPLAHVDIRGLIWWSGNQKVYAPLSNNSAHSHEIIHLCPFTKISCLALPH